MMWSSTSPRCAVRTGASIGAARAPESLWRPMEAWASITWLSTEYIEVGDKVVLAARARFHGRGSDVEVEGGGMGAVYMLRDGRIVRYQQLQSKAEALEAAGLREEAP